MAGHLKTTVFLISLSLAGCATGPSRDMVLSDQGYYAMEAGDMQKAESLLTEAVAENPDNPYALVNLGTLYQHTDRPELARPLFQRVVDGEADYAKAAETTEQSQEMARLVQLARDNLDIMDREQAAQQAAAEAESEMVPEPMPLVETPAPEFTYPVQIGAFASSANAERMSNQFMERHGDLIRDKEVRLVQVDGLAKVQVGPYETMTEASKACRAFKNAGVNCFPRRQ